MAKKAVMSYMQGGELLEKLAEAGLTLELAQVVIESRGNALAQKLVAHLLRESGLGFPPSHEIDRVFAGRYLGCELGRIRGFTMLPDFYSKSLTWRDLDEAKELGALLVAVPAVSLVMLAKRFPSQFGNWESFKDLPCAKSVVAPGYYLIVPCGPGSTLATYRDQVANRPKDWDVAMAAVIAYAAITYQYDVGRRLLEREVRCSDRVDCWGLSVYQAENGVVYVERQIDSVGRSALGAAYARRLE